MHIPEASISSSAPPSWVPAPTSAVIADPEAIPEASHFLQEDQGELLGIRIADWLAG